MVVSKICLTFTLNFLGKLGWFNHQLVAPIFKFTAVVELRASAQPPSCTKPTWSDSLKQHLGELSHNLHLNIWLVRPFVSFWFRLRLKSIFRNSFSQTSAPKKTAVELRLAGRWKEQQSQCHCQFPGSYTVVPCETWRESQKVELLEIEDTPTPTCPKLDMFDFAGSNKTSRAHWFWDTHTHLFYQEFSIIRIHSQVFRVLMDVSLVSSVKFLIASSSHAKS